MYVSDNKKDMSSYSLTNITRYLLFGTKGEETTLADEDTIAVSKYSCYNSTDHEIRKIYTNRNGRRFESM